MLSAILLFCASCAAMASAKPHRVKQRFSTLKDATEQQPQGLASVNMSYAPAVHLLGNQHAQRFLTALIETVKGDWDDAVTGRGGYKPSNGFCDTCFSMSGTVKLNLVVWALIKTLSVPGDFAETGTWRGGTAIVARATQRVLGEDRRRRTYVCDSFEGLPTATTSEDSEKWNKMNALRVSVDQVADNFEAFGLLDGGVRIVRGYFRYSLPILRRRLIEHKRHLAVLRGDGDMYESYLDILYNLYEFIPVGGIFICDDCTLIREAQRAITEFRTRHGITDRVHITGIGMLREGDHTYGLTWWKKTKPVSVDYTWYEKWNATRSLERGLIPPTKIYGFHESRTLALQAAARRAAMAVLPQ